MGGSQSSVGSYPRAMQVLIYDCPSNDKRIAQLYSTHRNYVNKYLLKPNVKLNCYLTKSIDKFKRKKIIPQNLFSFYFDNATQRDLEEFARNDPLIQSKLIQSWNCQLHTLVFDPNTIIENQYSQFSFAFSH